MIPEIVAEPQRSLPVRSRADVIVCGGGPAGIAAAVAAARTGARTMLLEAYGCLGGVWTNGCLSWIIDHENKSGIMRELLERVSAVGGRATQSDGTPSSGYDVETMKVVLDDFAKEAGVQVRLHTRIVAGLRDTQGRRLTHVITESKAGREAWTAKVFIDCTGDGDLAARAGCGFDMGDPRSGAVQPLSLMALLSGFDPAGVRPFLAEDGLPWGQPHAALRMQMERFGATPSYEFPTLFRISDGLYALMANHQYGVRCDDADGLSAATVAGRAEVFRLVRGLRSLGGPWERLHLVATGAQIGVREGRRIHGRYTVTADDVRTGARHVDAVCRAAFCVDIHSTDPSEGKGIDNGGVKAQPYDIPLRALIARDLDNLMMAGRCISGDFWAHGSYRVTGNAVAMGEAAGRHAARAALDHQSPCL
jgi:hypothetical protein